MNEAYNNLITRRTVRSFEPGPVPEEKLEAVLKAGTYAPTARGRQSPLIVAVENADDIALMEELNIRIKGADKKTFYGAPAVIVVFADPNARNGEYDAALVAGNILNAAHAVGLGACWVSMAKEAFETEEGKALKKKWGIASSWVGVAHCLIGVPAGPLSEADPRKPDYIVRIK